MLSTRNYVLNTVENFYVIKSTVLDRNAEATLSDFIDNSQTLLLHCVRENEKGLNFYTKIQVTKDASICFYKTMATELTTDNSMKYVNVLTLRCNAAESLYHILKQIFSPLITSFQSNDLHGNKLQNNLSDMISLLRIVSYGKGTENTNVIFSIEDELQYWTTVAHKRESNKKEKDAASNFTELFGDIIEEIRTMHSTTMREAREAAENIGGLLDDIWRFTTSLYPQDRMIHVFDIIGHDICSIIQKTFSSYDLWNIHNETQEYEILNLLTESSKVIQTWTSACKSLTETYWPNYALHPWIGKPYVPKFCSNFEARVKEICDMRSIYCQLFKLLTSNERSELGIHNLFSAFKDVDVWLCNGTNPSWETAVSRFAANLRPAETKIAEKLKPRLHNTSTKQMLYEFIRYQSLIQRPYVKQALNNELEIFVSSLLIMLKTIQGQLDADELDVKLYQPPEMSPIVHQIQWAKQMEAKVKEIHSCADKYLKEFEGCKELLEISSLLLKQLKDIYTQLHEEWCRDLQAQAKKNLLSLSMDKPVVEFSSSSKLMVVNFNPRLVWVELESRALAALGLHLPSVASTLETMTAALTHARTLQQVASFHNTLGERMIPSTRPMMLQAALDLSSLVQDQKAVYWDDIVQLTNYTDKLKKLVFQLETQNTYLTSQHIAIRRIVEKLLDTELLAKQAEWKKGVKEIRDIIETVENNGYKNTDLWRSHWDWQLFKALECQYIKTLLCLHKYFPHFRVDLVLRGRMVRIQPPIEEIRMQHYHQLRRLVSMPAGFVGVQTNLTQKESIFAAIVEKHGWLGNKAVAQIERALSSLERTCKEWTKRAALACVDDLDALCKQHLHEPKDWELNFKACKAYGQAVAKMTFEDEKIDWITVGTVTLRREFEAQTRTLWACLMSALQSSCINDASEIDAFVANAHITLENKVLPKNSKELVEVSSKQQAIQAKMPEMEVKVENLKKKSHMLRTWGGDTTVDGTIQEWKRIHELLMGQQQLFEQQAELVKSSLSGEWENLNTTVEAWASRWIQNKVKYEETHEIFYADMVDRCRLVYDAYAQWEIFVNNRDDLMKECEKFNMELHLPDTWVDVEKLMSIYINLWSVFKEYNEEYETIAQQEWIIFQKKLHLLDELVTKWKARLEPYTAVTLFIQQEIEKYTDLSPSLKYLRGTDFTERHWREVFNLLDIEYKKPDTLLVKDLLAAALNIKKHVKELQKICACASSESAIRCALNELELWYAGAKLAIAYYNNKTQKPIPVVKDFKDILAKIEEQQWIVSSVSGGDTSCATWEIRLRSARSLLRALYHAQRRWLYLEPVLSKDDGELGIKFRKVDQGFRQVTRIVESDPRLSALLQSSRVQSMLDSISEQLHACQSALNQYIDEKRTIFPRLYFLSDDDLLELLGQARAGAEGRAAVMQSHLKKLFPGITSVKLGPGDMSITGLCSHFGETFQLDHPVDIDCPVEVWLKNLETEMRSSLKNITLKCVVSNSLQEQDPFSMPTQILCLAQNIRFTEQAEKAIASKELHELKANIEKENLYYAAADVENDSERQKKQALILQCAYYMNVIRALINNNVVSTNDWLWQKQLRFYLLNTKEVIAKMGLAQISYSYEYLGVNTGQFVRTELTDECFLVLTQSLHFGFVGNPFGPAGTGKTESVKALGGLFGRLVLIFNCDEAMDAECMGRLLSGLALSGAWGCFDEFNRLTAETLAAVSHQLTSLLSATHQQKSEATPMAFLNGKQITVSEWCGVAATMNPAGRGYGGRRSIPAALERVLRPIAMMQPRGDQLSSHLLAARCIPHSDILARDLHSVFVMAGALLSGQCHYDWGLRALKAAVGSCGMALAGNPQRELGELRTVAKHVLTLNNVSKLTRHDAERFENILSLVFGDVNADNMVTNNIKSALDAAVQNLKLIPDDIQNQKCIELYEQLQQRMGVVIVGPSGSGKTTIRRLLRSALVHQGKNILEYVICPKAMSRDWLLGNVNHDTRQWTDGVISATALEISNQPSDITSWVVCDGDIDPEWIEALNSVLDENRLLTLPSGWRIQFGSNVNFIFETHSLEHASPATVSRMGIILMSDDVSCDAVVLENWIQKAESENDSLKPTLPILQQVIKMSIRWINTHKSDVILKVNNVTMVQQMLTQFEYVMQNTRFTSAGTTPEELIYLAVERSLFGIFKETSIGSFQEELFNILGPCPPSPLSQFEWISDALLMSPRLSKIEPMLRAHFTSNHSHVLVIGPEATAKNALTEYIIKESNSNLITIVCTPLLEPSDIIAELKRNNLIRSGGGGGAQVTLLVRALHRASVDSWGSSPVQSFLLQLIHHGGFWNRDSDEENSGTQWCYISRVRVVAIASSVTALSPRLSAAFAPCTIPAPEDDELLELIINYLRCGVENKFKQNEISATATKMLAFFKEASETFYVRPHYKWNASHLKKWCENVKWHSPSNEEELLMAIVGEVNFIFKDRLVLDSEKTEYIALIEKHFKVKTEANYYSCKVRVDGVYLEYVDYDFWFQTMEKLINQCLSEHEYNIFGDNGVEVCSELAIMYPAVARAVNGGLLICVGTAGCGRRAAAVIGAASIPAALFFVNHASQFNTQIKNALSSSGEGSRTMTVICESAVNADTLTRVKALLRAHSIHALPAPLTPNSNNPHLLENIKQNLGIIICLDKNQDDLAEVMEKHPMIYNDGHLIWLDGISDSSIREMPRLIVQRLMKENAVEVSKEELSSMPIDGFVNIYNSLENNQMRAPCRYFSFVKTYYNIISSKRFFLLQRQRTLSAGVEALRKARSEVKTLQEDAAEQSVALADKRAKANQALDQISATVRATTDKKEEMHALKKNIEIENEKLQRQKKEIESELASVEPVIEAARAAVGDIRPESLSEVRSLRAPPDVVRDVLEGVLRLMGIADTSWHSMKNFLSKRGVKEDIRCMDASQISPTALEGVRRLLERRGASFEPNTAKRASAACAPLASWVIANLHHADALARVKPLQAQQADLHRNLKEAENQLDALSSGLATVDERVAALKEQLGQHTHDAAAIELRLTNATNTIQAAKQLLDQLAHEYDAWEADLEYISKEITELSPRSLLAAAYIIYLPEITEPQARENINKWSNIIGYEDTTFSVINFLSTTEKQLKWDADGLPSDQSAVKNALLVDQVLGSVRCGFTPLIVDPDGDGINWLANTLANTQSDFISQQSEKLPTAVQYAVRLGRVLVITDVDNIHECWSPLLYGLPTNANSGSAPTTVRLILHSRDETLPSRLPSYYTARLSVLYFTARLDGLTDQLVYYALQQQNPEMTLKIKEIKLKKATLQKQQYELQENLLKDLSSNSDILHDTNLIASLNNTRGTNATIVEALEAASIIEESSRAACEAYTPSAKKTAIIALAVRRLAAKRPLIALPVDVVLDIYVDAVKKMENQSKINNEQIVKYITRRVIERVLLGLHKKDKYIVVLYLLKEVYKDLFPEELWQLFVGFNDLIDDIHNINEVKRTYKWMTDECVKKAVSLRAVNESLFSRLNLDKVDMWKEYLKTGDTNLISKLKLTPFETVVTVSILRPDSLYRAIVALIDQVLGAGAVSGGEAIWRAARCGRARRLRPLLVLGSHATDVLAAHAHANNQSFTQIGVEESKSVWDMAIEKARSGGWVALVVGASPFTHQLQAFITSFSNLPVNEFDEEFRLWIVSEDRDIPPLISNACINVILESPEGVKNNVMGTLSAWGNYESDPKTVRLHACLALFHALVQERRAYIPQGWSRWYAWEWGEIQACEAALRTKSGATPLCLALYTSRVSVDADKLLLSTLHRNYLGDMVTSQQWRPKDVPLRLPYGNRLQSYASAFDGLPDIDSPEQLGLPANCRIGWEKTAANNIVTGLKELNSSSVRNNSDSAPMKALLGLWKKLMSGSPLIKADYRFEIGVGGWWGCVCGGEVREAARLASTVHAALAHCARNVHTNRHLLHKVPDEWQLLWAGPDAPDAYIREFCFRARAAMARAIETDVKPDYMPSEIDLRSVLRPARVVWALRVRTATRASCSVDALALTVKWDYKDERSVDVDGLVVVGLRVSGAEWGERALHPATPTAPPHAPLPPLLLKYLPQTAGAPLVPEGTIEVPVYTNEMREEIVFYARAPLARDFDRDTAVLNAIALFIAPVDY